MTRRFGFALAAGALLALVVALPAAAGGWASVVDDEALPPDDGGTTVIRFRLLQHGETPVDWGEMSVTAVNAESGERVAGSAAMEAGAPGGWTASFRLPAAGTWTLEIRHQDLEVMSSHPIQVVATSASAAPAAGESPAASWIGAILLSLAILVPAGAALVLSRRHRPAPATAASARVTTPG